jgi:hypothetical protein
VSATVVERQQSSGTEAFAFPFCEFPLDVVSTLRGNYVIRAADGEAFLIRDTFQRVDVMTNPETGRWFTIRHTFLADTLGDGVPGAEEIPDTDVHDVSGPHAGFSKDFDFCAPAAQLTGA